MPYSMTPAWERKIWPLKWASAPGTLQRLFQEHLGSQPSAIIHNHRLMLARRLLATSADNLEAIARACGYGSARRLRQAMVQHHGHPPSALRSRRSISTGMSLRLDYRPPLPWNQLLSFWQQRAIPGVEDINALHYRRSFCFGSQPGWLELGPSSHTEHALEARVHHPDSRCLATVHQRLRHMFDLDAAPAEVSQLLAEQAPLAPSFALYPGLRVPGCWSLFEVCVRAILGQRISVAAARTVCARLVQSCGSRVEGLPSFLTTLFPEPEQLRQADLSDIGIPRARQNTLRELGGLFANPPEAQWAHDPDKVLQSLSDISGIGPWTLAYIRMRGLRDPDAWPAGDLILRQRLGAPASPLSTPQCEAASLAWRPWRAYAVMALWYSPLGDS